MNALERRREIFKALCRRRYDTFENLATEFGVSKRTIQRDIDMLSGTEPIYTCRGRYQGGVFIAENFYPDRMYMNDSELRVLKKLSSAAGIQESLLTYDEQKILISIISQYTKPKNLERIKK